jgi:hypothetical protein
MRSTITTLQLDHPGMQRRKITLTFTTSQTISGKGELGTSGGGAVIAVASVSNPVGISLATTTCTPSRISVETGEEAGEAGDTECLRCRSLAVPPEPMEKRRIRFGMLPVLSLNFPFSAAFAAVDCPRGSEAATASVMHGGSTNGPILPADSESAHKWDAHSTNGRNSMQALSYLRAPRRHEFQQGVSEP